MEVTPALHSYVETRCERLGRLVDKDCEIRVQLALEKPDHKAIATVNLAGRTLHGAPVALAQDTPQGAAHDASTWIKRLLPAHGDGDCRLYDQLAHGDMAPGLAVLVPAAPAVLLSVWAPAVPDWVRHVARCRAREPPRTLTLLPTALGA